MNPKILLTALVTLLLVSNVALAIPGIPHVFYGYVTLDGSPAPDGTTVTAKIFGEEVSSTTTKDGKYGYVPVFYVDDPSNTRAGLTVEFFVNGVNTGKTVTFCNACFNDCGTTSSNCPELNLSATSSSPSPEPSPSPSPGGPGGPGLSPSSSPEEEEEEEECEERWICGGWGECVAGIQTRTCTDTHACGTEKDKPMESQPCSTVLPEEEEEEGVPSGDGFTGMFTLLTNPLYALLLALFVIAIILTIFRNKVLAFVKKK